MSQNRIKHNLEALFLDENRWRGCTPKVVFWNDTDAEFDELFHQLELEKVPQLKKQELTSHNAWRTKQVLYQATAEDSFLFYQVGAVPPPREDWLLDARLYGQHFSARRSEMLHQELGFTHPEMKAFIADQGDFFNAQERLKKLQAFEPAADISPENLSMSMMAVLLNLKHPDANTILQQVLQEGLVPEQNLAWQGLCKYVEAERFFALCQQTLRMSDLPTSLRQVLMQVAVTHFSHQYAGSLPQQWQAQAVHPSNACFRFVDHWIHDDRVRDQWYTQAERIAEDLGLSTLLEKSAPANYVGCETFSGIDKALITHLRDTLIAQPDTASLLSCDALLQQRKPLRTLPIFTPFYLALESAVQLFLTAERYVLPAGVPQETATAYFEHYQRQGWKVDQAYRHYWQQAMALTDSPLLQSLHPKVEQCYRSVLHWQAEHWDACLSDAGVWPLPGLPSLPQQTDFFEKQVWVKSNQGEQRTVVIISDAMRYEVAQELQTRLAEHLPGQSELEAMAGVLPSRTHFGMSALLPRPDPQPLALELLDQSAGESEGQSGLRIQIDGQRPENNESRGKLLAAAGQRRGGKNLNAYRYSDVIPLKREAGRELTKSFQVAYIYHDQIDATGDKPANQDQVFMACARTVDELFTLIKRLLNWNVSQVIVTADHGFLYQYEDLGDADKIDLPTNTLMSKRRCALATAPVATPGVLSLRLTHYTHPFEALYALLPRGVQRFRKQGGSTKYAHGGATLQEICVPVLTYNHVKTSLNKVRPKTGVRVLAPQRRITNNVFSLPLLQEQPVNDNYRGRQVRVFFETESGQMLSNCKTVVFDSDSNHAPDREQRIALTLASQEQRLQVRLRIVDDEDEYDVIEPEYWDVSLSFSNEFGF